MLVLPPRKAENEAVSRRRSYLLCAAALSGALPGILSGVLLGACLLGSPAIRVAAQQPASHARATPPPEVRPEARIDINHASMEELLRVPGLTRSWAGRILRYRPYRTKQDLLDGGVVPSEVYDRIKDFVIAHRDKR